VKRSLVALLLVSACSSGGPSVPDTVAVKPATGVTALASWSPWPQAGHDARRSGSTTVNGPTTDHLRWTRKLEGNVTPGPVVAPDGTIVAASNAGILHGLDPATGDDRWTFDAKGGYGIDLSTSPAVLKDGTVLWPGPHNTLYALDSGGKLLWTEGLDGQPSSPAVTGDGSRAVVGSSGGTVVALDLTAGHRRLWTVDVGGSSYGSVALSPTDPKRAYQTVDHALVAIDDGTIAWKADLKEVTEVSPAVAPDGTIVVGDNSPHEYGFHPDGSRAWTYEHGGQTYSSPVVTEDGTAWFGDHRAFVTGVDVSNGMLRGRFRGESVEPAHGPSVGVWTSPLIDAAHNVYWGTRLGHVYGRAADGTKLFDLATGATVDSYPALTGDGLLVVGVTDDRLLGIGADA
jgi:outer membrane protein assembly factor BamB